MWRTGRCRGHELEAIYLSYFLTFTHMSDSMLYRYPYINSVSRTLLLIRIAMKTKWPPIGSITLLYIDYISTKTRSSALMKAYLWSTNDGNASWTVNGRQGLRQGMKPASGKISIVLISILNLILIK